MNNKLYSILILYIFIVCNRINLLLVKVEAEHLFRTSPDLYKDPNHKPELAIALTPFLTLCGFRPHHDLYAQLKQLEPLVRLLGDANIEALKEAGNGGLEKCFAKLMLSEPQAVEVCINELIAHFKQPGISGNHTNVFIIFLTKNTV